MSTVPEGDTGRDALGPPTAMGAGSSGAYAAADPTVTTTSSAPRAYADDAAYAPPRSTQESSHEKAEHASIGELVGDISQGLTTLLRQEVELAKAEVGEKGKKAGVSAGMFGAAGVAALLTLGSLTAFLILVLDLATPAWAAALIVGAVWAAVTGVLAVSARRKVHEMGKPVPEQTIETVKEDVQWAKHPTKSGTR